MPLQKEQLWLKFIEKNPHWLTDGVKLTPAGLKKLFETTFEKGHELDVANGKALVSKKDTKNNTRNRAESFVDSILGKRY
jgi:hypothetical protein